MIMVANEEEKWELDDSQGDLLNYHVYHNTKTYAYKL